MVRRSSFSWACVLLLAVVGGCQAILPFDEDKLDASSGGGGQGPGGATATSSTQGGGGHTSSQGGGTSSTMTGGGGTGGAPECTAPDDCETGSECIAPTCLEQKCGSENVASGMLVAAQTAGDCKSAVCDGNGGIVLQDDDADAFDDGKDCTLDTCNAGSSESAPAMSGTSCNDDGGKVCDGLGDCVQCNGDADCAAAAPKCAMHVCVPASCDDGVKNGSETDTDCGGACGATCAPGDVCAMAADCLEGVCTGTVCAMPLCSDDVTNGAETDKDCGGGTCPKCGPAKGCDVNADCAGNQCSGAGGVCVPNCNDGVKNNAETGKDCGGGTCAGCAAGGACGQDNDCVSTAYCDVTMTCAVKKPNGTACSGVNQCATGNCADGVCCNVACGGTCLACNLAGAAGTCSPIAAGQDPIDECAGATAVCDGAGNCKKAIGQSCATSGDCALGNCVDGVCCNSTCGGACVACNLAGSVGACTSIAAGQDPANECIGAVSCNGNGACGSLFPTGTACSINNECQSGSCADGVCCNSACNGVCSACNLAGSVGACTSIPNSQDPANECTNGACNGAGACKLDNGQACAGNSACLGAACVDGVCCNSACSGTCQACSAAKTGGANGTCANIVASTDPDNECNSGACSGAGTCKLDNGQLCVAASNCLSGNCADGVCCNTACGATCQACSAAKTGGASGTCANIAANTDPDSECAGAMSCNGAGACALAAQGAACSANAECATGFCADGFCCDSACTGLCKSCTGATNFDGNGVCSNIACGDPQNECFGAKQCTGNGTCGDFCLL